MNQRQCIPLRRLIRIPIFVSWRTKTQEIYVTPQDRHFRRLSCFSLSSCVLFLLLLHFIMSSCILHPHVFIKLAFVDSCRFFLVSVDLSQSNHSFIAQSFDPLYSILKPLLARVRNLSQTRPAQSSPLHSDYLLTSIKHLHFIIRAT